MTTSNYSLRGLFSKLALLALLAVSAVASEPSAFGAGNIESSEPYGLTDTEKLIYKNRQLLNSSTLKTSSNSQQIEALQERIDGLQSVIESISRKSQNNSRTLVSIQESDTNESVTQVQFSSLSASVDANTQNIKKMKKILEEVAVRLDSIYTTYVSKSEYNALVNDVNRFKKDVSEAIGSTTSNTKPLKPQKRLSNTALMKLAKSNYSKLYFKKAIPQFEELIERNYKPATSHFMIAQMWHYRKSWDKALSHYKVSASLDPKAKYMPELMLHSAECMIGTNDNKNAKSFLEALIASYPDTKEAEKAYDMLDLLR